MSKKGKDKKVSQLRAEVEFLRSQLKSTVIVSEKINQRTQQNNPLIQIEKRNPLPLQSQKKTVVCRVEPEQLKKDLIKTLTLTAFSLIILFTLYYTQPYLPALIRNFAQILQNSPLKFLTGGS